MSVGLKFGAIIALCTALVLTATTTAITERFQAQDAIRSEDVARATAARICTAVQSVFENAFDIVNNTHDDLIALKDEGITDPHVYDTLLKRMIDAGTNRYGAWLVWDRADAPLDAATGQDRRDAAGRFAFYWHQNGIEMLRDSMPPEIYGSDLYRVPHDSDKAYLLDPHAINAVDGDATLVTSFSKPLEHDGKVVGALDLDIKLDAITEALDSIILPEGASIAVVSDGGIVAMSTTKAAIGHPLSVARPDLAGVLAQARHGDGSTLANDNAARVLTSWNAIRFAGVKNPWYLLMKVPERSLLSTTSNDRMFLAIVSGLGLLAILALVLLAMNRLISRPLKALSDIIGGLGRGLFDFTIPSRDRMDEVGDIARAIVRLQESSLEIARLKEASGEDEYQRQLARRAELDGISAHFSLSIEAMVRTLDGGVATVETQSREVSVTTQAASLRLGHVSDASAVARTSMASVVSATSALHATIDAIGRQTRQSKAAAEKVERQTASTDQSLRQLKQTIQDIDGVAALIRDVAAQINLIALNATIEAARAGDAGLGFAVVAHEIKGLATQTAKATEDIGRHIAAVQKASGHADGTIADMKQAFEEMRAIATGVAGSLHVQLDATSEIGDLVRSALGGADGVAQNLSELVMSSHHVRGAADVMLAQSSALGQEIAGLTREVGNFMRFLKAA